MNQDLKREKKIIPQNSPCFDPSYIIHLDSFGVYLCIHIFILICYLFIHSEIFHLLAFLLHSQVNITKHYKYNCDNQEYSATSYLIPVIM